MKFTGHSVCVLVLLLFLNSWTQEKKRLANYEPLLGLSYDVDSVKFEPLPQSTEARKTFDGQQQWIFAQCQRQDHKVFVVSGWIKNWSDAGNGDSTFTIGPDFGSVIKITGNKIVVLGVPDGLFVTGKYAILPLDEAICLMDDAAKRYEKAFGGPAKLQKALIQKGIAAEDLPKTLVDALKSRSITVPANRKK